MNNRVKALVVAGILVGLISGVFVFMNKGDGPKPDTGYENTASDSSAAVEEAPKVIGSPPPELDTRVVTVTGTVVDEDGTALEGVEIKVHPVRAAASGITKTTVAQVATNPAGAFTVEDLRPGKYTFQARKSGYQEGREIRTLVVDQTPEPIAFVLSAGLTISGYVKDSFNKPIEGAEVTAFIERIEEDASLEDRLRALTAFSEIQSETGISAVSNEEGWYQIVGLELRDYRLRAVASELSPAQLRYVAAGTQDANFFLEPGGLLTGTVTTAGGDAIEGAAIAAYRQPSAEDQSADIIETVLAAIMPPLATVETDLDGRFAFDELGPGEQYRLVVKALTYQSEQIDKVVVSTDENADILVTLEQGKVIRGIVHDPDGRPAPGCTVKVTLQSGRAKTHDLNDDGVVTDDQGFFMFDTLEEGNYRIVASHPDYASAQENRVEPSEEDVVLTLTIGGAVSGLITDSESGSPISGAEVSVRDLAGIEKKGVTDAEGFYLVRGISVPRRGKTALSVEAENYARESNQQVPVQEGVVSEGYDYALKRNGVVSGFVRDSDGTPVPGVKVTVKRQFSPTVPVVVNVGSIVESGPDGRFLVDGVAPGDENYLEGSHPDYLDSNSETFALTPAENMEGLILVMQRGGSISGVIVDESGAPIENAVVGIQGEYQFEMPVSSMEKHAFTDAGGNYSIRSLEAESHTLVAEADGFLRTRLTGVDVVEGRNTPNTRLTLVRASYLSGYVVDTRGEPVRNAKVTIIDSAEGLRRIPVRTDTNGMFSCDTLGPYPVEVEAEAPSYTKVRLFEQPVNVENVRIVLERMGSISGQVYDNEGNPVRAFSVSPKKLIDGRPLPKVPAKTFQNPNAEFRYDGVEPGEYQVILGAPGYTVEILDNIQVQSDSVTNLGRITLGQGGRISGRVLDATNGQPVYGATVTVVGGDAQFLPPVPEVGVRRPSKNSRRNVVRTDRNGFFEIIGLSVDGVSLRIEHRSYMSISESGIPAGSTDLLFEMDQGGVITGRVLNGDGVALPQQQVFLMGNGKNDRQVTDRKGFFTFTGLVDGRYTLRASQIGMKEATRSGPLEKAPSVTVDVRAGETSEVDINIDIGDGRN